MAKITGFQVTNNNVDEVLDTMREQVLIGLEAIGQEAEGYAKDECPVDTGRLRNSISNEVDSDEPAVYVGTNVEYAPYVEFGDANHKTGNAHFLRNSIFNHIDHYKEIMTAALES